MHRIPVILALALLMVSCNSIVKKKTIDAKSVNFEATYNEDFDNVLYPSMLLALANYRGDDMDTLFTVSVVAPQNNALLRIVVDSTVLNYVSITQEMLPKKGNKYTFGLNYRPTNECLMSLIGKDGRYHDYRWLFAAYVDEDHPKIDGILSEILSQGIVTTFDGAKNEKKVETQMRAIWYYALNRGLSYSSITCTSNGSKKTNSQYIRFFDDVYVNRQANCIDACVFFSSIMRKVGLLPVIFVDPCHAYLGYYTDKSKKKIALLETTITGWVNLPELDEHYDAESGLLEEKYYAKISKYLNDRQKATYEAGKMTLEDIKKAVANNLFDRAADYQKENYKNNRLLYSDTSQQMYRMLVIDEMRPLISPIPAVEE